MTSETERAEYPDMAKHVEETSSPKPWNFGGPVRWGAIVSHPSVGERPYEIGPAESEITGTDQPLAIEGIAIVRRKRDAALIVAAVNALHVIAPGREWEAANILPELVEDLRRAIKERDYRDSIAQHDAPTNEQRSREREWKALERAVKNARLLGAPPQTKPVAEKPAAFPLSRDLHTNVSRFRTILRCAALNQRRRAEEAARLAKIDVAKGVEPSSSPDSAAADAMARILENYANDLDAILAHEETVTTTRT